MYSVQKKVEHCVYSDCLICAFVLKLDTNIWHNWILLAHELKSSPEEKIHSSDDERSQIAYTHLKISEMRNSASTSKFGCDGNCSVWINSYLLFTSFSHSLLISCGSSQSLCSQTHFHLIHTILLEMESLQIEKVAFKWHLLNFVQKKINRLAPI